MNNIYADDAVNICTVSFCNAEHLRLNWRLVDRLNRGGTRLQWIVAENSPEDAPDRLPMNDDHFMIIEGERPGQYSPNFQHTIALHKCLDRASTRFVLVLDPDFYIVRPNWANEVIKHMERHELAFFGVPWHPRLAQKYRYFPAVHCFFFDRERVSLADLDFRPIGDGQKRLSASDAGDQAEAQSEVSRRLQDWLGLTARRKQYFDTGTRIYKRYSDDKTVRYECALPVFRLPEDAPVSQSWRVRILEHLLPDELCYLPKRRDSYVGNGLRELGYLAGAPTEWEEFMWQGVPFGFHVRRNLRKAKRDAQQELAILRGAVEAFM